MTRLHYLAGTLLILLSTRGLTAEPYCISYFEREKFMPKLPGGSEILSSPDGSQFFTIDANNRLIIANNHTGQRTSTPLPAANADLSVEQGNKLAVLFFMDGNLYTLNLETGQMKNILPGGNVFKYLAMTGPSSSVSAFTVDDGRVVKLINLKSGEETTIAPSRRAVDHSTMPPISSMSPLDVARASQDGHLKLQFIQRPLEALRPSLKFELTDVKSGRQQNFTVPSGVTNFLLNSDGTHALFQYPGRVSIRNLQTGTSQNLETGTEDFHIADNEKSIYWITKDAANKRAVFHYKDIGPGDAKQIPIPFDQSEYPPQVISSRNPDYVLISGGGSRNTIVFNLKSGQSFPVRAKIPWNIRIPSTGDKFLLLDDKDILTEVDISHKTSKPIAIMGGPLPEYSTPVQIVRDQLLYRTNDNLYRVRDTLTGDDDPLPSTDDYDSRDSPFFDGKQAIGHCANGTWSIFRKKVCNLKDVQIKVEDCADCREKENSTPEKSNVLQILSHQGLCARSFDRVSWDKVAPLPSNTVISLSEARALLLRFQKPGGFIPEEHWPTIKAILSSSLTRTNPGEVSAALQNILITSPGLYSRLVATSPSLATLKPSSAGESTCRTPAENRQVKLAVLQFLEEANVRMPQRTTFTDWNFLKPIAPILQDLTTEQKEAYAAMITEKVSAGAADKWEYRGVFQSKLYKLAYQAIAPLFGMPTKDVTDVSLIRDRDSVTPIILGSHDIDGDPKTKNEFGFAYRRLNPISIPENVKPNTALSSLSVQWKQNDHTFSAKLDIGVGENGANLVNVDKSPNYRELWQTKNFTGIVVTGSNLGGSLSVSVVDEYLAYYQAKGFVFAKASQPVNDLRDFLENKITSGEAHYLIKEAHSDGDERNLFRIYKQAQVKTGVLRKADGTSETVHLVFPSTRSSETELLPNSDFGNWIRTRGNAGKGQFLYLNTSCWSVTKARWEIEAAHSKTLVNIPVTLMADTFVNEASNAEYIILDGLRQKKTYEEIRWDLQKNREYQSGHGNTFIFPDEDAYKTNILDIVRRPISAKIVITDQNGRLHNIDQY